MFDSNVGTNVGVDAFRTLRRKKMDALRETASHQYMESRGTCGILAGKIGGIIFRLGVVVNTVGVLFSLGMYFGVVSRNCFRM